jgi:hypothetical protein
MSVIDKSRFEAAGGNGCGSSVYVLQRTTCCAAFAVEDRELADLYLDPADLRRTLTLMYDPSADAPPPRPFRSADDWDMVEVHNVADVPPAWRWAAKVGGRLTPT